MIPSLVTAPDKAIAWSEMQSHLRLDSDDERARVEGVLLPAATEWVQALTNRQLMPATFTFWYPSFEAACAAAQRHPCRYPYGTILVPYPPLQSVTWVKYYDLANSIQTWAASNYTVSAPAGPKCGPGWIAPLPFVIYPNTYFRPDAVELKVVCGYPGQSTIPGGLKASMLLHIGGQFEQRENTIVEAPQNAVSMALSYLVEF
jgi:uncharacterized phiE125 gp8 family phage protein